MGATSNVPSTPRPRPVEPTVRKTLPLLLALALTVAWTGVTGAFDQAEPRDAKAEFAFSGVADVADEALAAMIPGVGLPCTAGFAGPYPCDGVDLLGLVPLAELGGAAGNDSWGWTHVDPETGDRTELAIMGTGLGTAFIDVTDPVNPAVIGTTGQAGGLAQGASGVLWRDVKVDGDHAFIVSERGGGMQVVDLLEVIAEPGDATRDVPPVATYTGQGAGAFHNIAINEETDRAYLVGGNFAGGLHIVDISDPTEPQFLGAFEDDGYTHDVQCVIYRGPDADYNGGYAGRDADGDPSNGSQAELCFASNEDSVTVVDVTDPGAPVEVTRTGYASSAYTHQGWLTPDQRFFVFNDEVDETAGTVSNTTTYMVEFDDLDREYTEEDVQTYEHETISVDHNLYIDGDLIFLANYNAGLRVLRYTPEGLRTGDLEEVAFFDVDPALDINQYGGAWNVYPFFESGTIIVSSLDEGLYTLRLSDDEAEGLVTGVPLR